jgi:hypothetical protein
MNKQVFFILEIFWLIVGILGFAAGIYETTRNGLKESWMFFLISAVGLGMYFMRRNLRKRTSKQ